MQKREILTFALICLILISNVFGKNKDYYEIMGVPKSATTAQIKKAFRKLALKYHPGCQSLLKS